MHRLGCGWGGGAKVLEVAAQVGWQRTQVIGFRLGGGVQRWLGVAVQVGLAAQAVEQLG